MKNVRNRKKFFKNLSKTTSVLIIAAILVAGTGTALLINNYLTGYATAELNAIGLTNESGGDTLNFAGYSSADAGDIIENEFNIINNRASNLTTSITFECVAGLDCDGINSSVEVNAQVVSDEATWNPGNNTLKVVTVFDEDLSPDVFNFTLSVDAIE